ncbi:MAG: hypothetical protein Q9159_000886 [Coniocarpon cinnabarinum]
MSSLDEGVRRRNGHNYHEFSITGNHANVGDATTNNVYNYFLARPALASVYASAKDVGNSGSILSRSSTQSPAFDGVKTASANAIAGSDEHTEESKYLRAQLKTLVKITFYCLPVVFVYHGKMKKETGFSAWMEFYNNFALVFQVTIACFFATRLESTPALRGTAHFTIDVAHKPKAPLT